MADVISKTSQDLYTLINTFSKYNINNYMKETLQPYCVTKYSRSGENQIWILENSIELSVNLKS